MAIVSILLRVGRAFYGGVERATRYQKNLVVVDEAYGRKFGPATPS